MGNLNLLITLLSENSKIHGYFCTISDLADEIGILQELSPVSKAVFLRVMVAGTLLSGNLKNPEDILTLKWDCTGPASHIVFQIDGSGSCKGTIGNRNLMLAEGLSEKGAFKTEPYIGFGEFTVSRRLHRSSRDYNSVGVIETGEIAQDITRFLRDSLQVDSGLKIGLNIKPDNTTAGAGGILFMAMPGASDNDIDRLEELTDSIESMTEFVTADGLFKIEDFAKKHGFFIVSSREITYKCGCSDKKIIAALSGLKTEEFAEYITEDGTITCRCEYCNKQYKFLPQEINPTK